MVADLHSGSETSPDNHLKPPRYSLRTRVVTEKTSSIERLLVSHQKEVAASIPAANNRMDRSLRARQVRRFRNHLLESDKHNAALGVIADADADFLSSVI
ncbi:hypothetical protein ColLi_13991 [Colletotrichum liriopes]|uniref:Uncharacterized protein n=1 Tax=Colletotrichum liriopes TaxID=708192 RepID=A0AA37M171_9PEZI|nr:hypothetical protein ColLi_13991 [Colletotrichum liriopes]